MISTLLAAILATAAQNPVPATNYQPCVWPNLCAEQTVALVGPCSPGTLCAEQTQALVGPCSPGTLCGA